MSLPANMAESGGSLKRQLIKMQQTMSVSVNSMLCSDVFIDNANFRKELFFLKIISK